MRRFVEGTNTNTMPGSGDVGTFWLAESGAAKSERATDAPRPTATSGRMDGAPCPCFALVHLPQETLDIAPGQVQWPI
jgi:hypothetical protein